VKVCGIVGSPVKNGNVDLLVSRVLEGASSQRAEVHKLYLNDLSACEKVYVEIDGWRPM
jgi:multimeric flavodoxin WrbA